MTSCEAVRENLTAWVDGELSSRWTDRVHEHVEHCADCAAEAESLRASVALQRSLLQRLTVATDIDATAMRARLRRAVAAEDASPRVGWRWILRPVLLVPALAVLAVMMLFTTTGDPSDFLVPLGVKPPPPAVTRAPDLFKDYTLIQNLDALRHFDTVEAEPLDDDSDAQTG